jgi:hypothetical protein
MEEEVLKMRDGGAVKSIFPWADQPKEKYILTRQFSVKRTEVCTYVGT